jgi:hypothetical protein
MNEAAVGNGIRQSGLHAGARRAGPGLGAVRGRT